MPNARSSEALFTMKGLKKRTILKPIEIEEEIEKEKEKELKVEVDTGCGQKGQPLSLFEGETGLKLKG